MIHRASQACGGHGTELLQASAQWRAHVHTRMHTHTHTALNWHTQPWPVRAHRAIKLARPCCAAEATQIFGSRSIHGPHIAPWWLAQPRWLSLAIGTASPHSAPPPPSFFHTHLCAAQPSTARCSLLNLAAISTMLPQPPCACMHARTRTTHMGSCAASRAARSCTWPPSASCFPLLLST